MAPLIAVAVFIAVTTFVLSTQLREQEHAGASQARIDRATGKAPPLNYGAGQGIALRGSRISSSEALTQLLGGLSFAYNIERHLNRSDWKSLKVSDFLVLSAVSGLLPLAIVDRLTGSIWIGAAVGLLGLFIPRFLLSRNIKKRRARFNHQLVEVLTQIANSLKAGFGLLQALAQAADESKPPISTELQQTLRDIQVGASVEDAFNNLDERVGSEDLDIVITAILVQRGAGGSLAEIIEGVSHTMRERIRIRGEIDTLTTQGKYTGYLIGALPIILAGGFFLMNRQYEELLFITPLGHVMLAVWAVMQTIGLLIIRKILNIEL
ncbi:MAG TPA: type II secretion system F family protein [Dehalococcoidia bacterium]|nr:type II secretion system F family protein [Dehalococcoidia bacterium]